MTKTELAEKLREGVDADIWYDAGSHGDEAKVELIETIKFAMCEAADVLAEAVAEEEIGLVGPCRFQPADVRLQADYVAEYMDIPDVTDEDVEAIWSEVSGDLKHVTDVGYGNDLIVNEIERYFQAKMEEEDAND